MTNSTDKPTTSFWIIGVLALLWYAFGVLQYLMQAYMTDEALMKLPEAERALYENVPAWVTGAFAIAVFSGLVGCILLLMRKKLATTLFLISMVALLVQQVYNVFLSTAREVYGDTALLFPLLIVVVGAFMIWYSRQMTAKGILK